MKTLHDGYGKVIAATLLAALTLAWFGVGKTLAGAAVPGSDLALTLALQGQRGGLVETLLILVSDLGFAVPFFPLVALIACGLWLAGLRREGGYFLATLATGYSLAWGLGELVARVRPASDLVWVHQELFYSGYPSKHVVSYVLVFGFLFYLALANGRSHWERWLGALPCLLLVSLVGPSRVFLGAHWTSDVVAGYLFGGLWLGLGIYAYRRFSVSRRLSERSDNQPSELGNQAQLAPR
jgi:membrane-associated phospholipid phosphatase